MGFSQYDLKNIANFLSPLERRTQGLGTAAYEYVVTGEQPQVLEQIAATLQTIRLWSLATDRHARALLLRPQGWDTAIVRRLGEVLALQLRTHEGYHWHFNLGAQLEFFWALACATDLLLVFLPTAPVPWLLTGPRCLALLELASADQSALVEILFTPYTRSDGRLGRFHGLFKMDGLPAALTAGPARTVLGAKSLRGATLCHFLGVLHSGGLTALHPFRNFLLEIAAGAGPAAKAALGALLRLPDARALLEQQVARASPSLRRKIREALKLLPPPADAPAAQAQDGKGYVSLGGSTAGLTGTSDSGVTGNWIAIPVAPPLPADTPPPKELKDALHAAVREAHAAYEEFEHQFTGSELAVDGQLLPESGIGSLMDVMGGAIASLEAVKLLGQSLPDTPYWQVIERYRRTLRAVLSHPEVTLHHLARLFVAHPQSRKEPYSLVTGAAGPVPLELLHRAARAAGDLRTVLEVCGQVSGRTGPGGAADVLQALLQLPQCPFPPGARPPLWQVIAEHLDLIDEALGLAATRQRFVKARALELLLMLPATPERYRGALVDLAMLGSPEERPLARALLAEAPGIETQILAHLVNGDQKRRCAAAQWLQARGERATAGAVRAALAWERTQAVRIALMETLAALGEDVCNELRAPGMFEEAPLQSSQYGETQERLLGELPALKWVDGQAVPPGLARDWVLQAFRLKTPHAPPVLRLALDHLEVQGAQQLGLLLLNTYVTCRYRGLLALTGRAAPHEAVLSMRPYLLAPGYSGPRIPLLSALADRPALPILQLLEEVWARSRKKKVRAHANALLARFAAERGLTREELADRAIPSGGLDERGELRLHTGKGTLTASVGSDLQVQLKDAQGKIVQSLRAPDDGSREALKRLRQELPLIVQEQSARLHQAMRTGRLWRLAEIRAYLFAHPVTGLLCQALIFAGVDALGDISQTFRPLPDGSHINAAGEPVDIAGCLSIRLAHRGLMDEAQVRAWQQHLEDYQLVPPFAQLR